MASAEILRSSTHIFTQYVILLDCDVKCSSCPFALAKLALLSDPYLDREDAIIFFSFLQIGRQTGGQASVKRSLLAAHFHQRCPLFPRSTFCCAYTCTIHTCHLMFPAFVERGHLFLALKRQCLA